MTFETHPAVIDVDLVEIGAFIARDNLMAAEAVLLAIEATFDQLKHQPLSGVAWRSPVRKLAGMRMLPVQIYPTYLIFHRANADFVRILYVVHSARDLPTLFQKDVRE